MAPLPAAWLGYARDLRAVLSETTRQPKSELTQRYTPMETSTHTPAPWFINPRGFVVDATGAIVTRMEGSEDAGNAAVVCGAPEALAILKRIQAIPANEPGRVVMLMPEINALVRRMEGRK